MAAMQCFFQANCNELIANASFEINVERNSSSLRHLFDCIETKTLKKKLNCTHKANIEQYHKFLGTFLTTFLRCKSSTTSSATSAHRLSNLLQCTSIHIFWGNMEQGRLRQLTWLIMSPATLNSSCARAFILQLGTQLRNSLLSICSSDSIEVNPKLTYKFLKNGFNILVLIYSDYSCRLQTLCKLKSLLSVFG